MHKIFLKFLTFFFFGFQKATLPSFAPFSSICPPQSSSVVIDAGAATIYSRRRAPTMSDKSREIDLSPCHWRIRKVIERLDRPAAKNTHTVVLIPLHQRVHLTTKTKTSLLYRLRLAYDQSCGVKYPKLIIDALSALPTTYKKRRNSMRFLGAHLRAWFFGN